MRWGKLVNASLLVVILAVATHFIRPTFEVHDSGVVVITGTSSGIGKAATLKLASLGYTVLAGVRKESDGIAMLDGVDSHISKNIVPTIIDVTDIATIDNAVVTAGKMGKVVGVICNAGIDVGSNIPVEYMDPSAEELVFKVNYFGVRNTATRFLPLLRASKGRLITTGSIAGSIAGPFNQPYSATKHAVRSLSDSLRHELKPLGISVSRLDPGFVKTNILGYGSEETSAFQSVSPENRQVYEKELNRVLATMIPMAEMAATTDETDAAIVHALTSKRPQPVYHPGTIGGIPARITGFIFKFLEAIDPSWVDALMEVMATIGEYAS